MYRMLRQRFTFQCKPQIRSVKDQRIKCVWIPRAIKKPVQKETTWLGEGQTLTYVTATFSAIMVLSACTVMMLSARETAHEALELQEQYRKVHDEVNRLEDKQAEDEYVLNLIVQQIIELKNVGII